MNSTTTCQWTGKTCGYGSCTLPTHVWNFATQTCATTVSSPMQQVVTGGTNSTTTENFYAIGIFTMLLIVATVVTVAVTFVTRKLT